MEWVIPITVPVRKIYNLFQCRKFQIMWSLELSLNLTLVWWLFNASITAGLLPLMVILRFLLLCAFRSPKPTSLAMALAVSLLNIGDEIGVVFPFWAPGGGLSELLSLEAVPNSLSCALRELLGLSSCKMNVQLNYE